MSNITLTLSVPLIAAVVAAELMSFLYYSIIHRHDLGDRYIVTGIACDVAMAFILQYITSNYYRVGKWEDAAILAGMLTVFFACLHAPHSVHNGHSANRFFINILHKFGMIFAMAMAMVVFKDY